MAVHVASGKVREIYALDDTTLLIVATDRISAYDVILPDPIPDKGRILTGLTVYWLGLLGVPHHLLTTDVSGIHVDGMAHSELEGRSMVVRKAEVIPLECVVRGFLFGSAWEEYRKGGGPATEHLPPGLQRTDRLPEPVFTPALKAQEGHDQNLTAGQARDLIGADLYDKLRQLSVGLYQTAAGHASGKGLILADTKFEFGLADGEPLLIDEVLTPDSSRYWPASAWHPPDDPASFDKQYVRAWLDGAGWDRTPPAPRLPTKVISETRDRYLEAYRRICGRPFEVPS